MFKRAAETFLAIDLAPECVRVLDVSVRRGEPSVKALASEALTDKAADGLPERQLAALERILDIHRLRNRVCIAAMPTTLVTTRSVIVDPAKPLPLEDQIRQTLQNILSFDSRDLLFDYWNVTEPTEKVRSHEVLVVAAQCTVVHRYLDGFQRMKLACTHLDVAPCALASLIARLVPQEGMTATVALGESLGYFAMVDKQRVLFWRPFDMPPAKNGPQWMLERVGDEVSKCVSHMVGSQRIDNLAEIMLFQSFGTEPAFGDYLASRFNVQIARHRCLNPSARPTARRRRLKAPCRSRPRANLRWR